MAGEAGGIGARLRAGREKLGLTVLQAAEKLHTDPRVIDAIEVEDFETLGAPVYARGHIRHYAELVGESGEELSALYANLGRIGLPDLTRIAKAPPPVESNKLVAPALVAIAVFAGVGAIWWVSALSARKPRLADTHVLGPTEPSGAAGDSSAAPTSAAPAAGAPGTASGPGASALAATVPAAGTPTAVGVDASGGSAARAATAPQAGTPGPATPPIPGGKSQVTLHYKADSWTEVYDANGSRLFYDVGAADTVKTFSGIPPLRVVLGNASGVAVEFNGHSASIGNFLQSDGSAQFSITRSGRVVRARQVADGG